MRSVTMHCPRLPRDLLVVIFLSMEKDDDVFRCMAVCRKWKKILQSDAFWRKRFGNQPLFVVMMGHRPLKDVNQSNVITCTRENHICLNFLLESHPECIHVLLIEEVGHLMATELTQEARHLTLLAWVSPTRVFSNVTHLALHSGRCKNLLSSQFPCLCEVDLHVGEQTIVPQWILKCVVTVHFTHLYSYGMSGNRFFLNDLPKLEQVVFDRKVQMGCYVLSWETDFVERAANMTVMHNLWLDIDDFPRDFVDQMSWLTSTFINLHSLTVVVDSEPAVEEVVDAFYVLSLSKTVSPSLDSLELVFVMETTPEFVNDFRKLGRLWAENVHVAL